MCTYRITIRLTKKGINLIIIIILWVVTSQQGTGKRQLFFTVYILAWDVFRLSARRSTTPTSKHSPPGSGSSRRLSGKSSFSFKGTGSPFTRWIWLLLTCRVRSWLVLEFFRGSSDYHWKKHISWLIRLILEALCIKWFRMISLWLKMFDKKLTM